MSTASLDQQALVCAVELNKLRLRIQRPVTCRQCSKQGGCGITVLPARSPQTIELPISANNGLGPGRQIGVSLPLSGFIRLVLLQYLSLPLALFVGAAVGSWALPWSGDIGGLAGAVGGLAVGGALLNLYDARAGRYWLRRLQVRSGPPQRSFRPR